MDRGTVLVVEDDESMRDLVVEALRRDGHVVLAASSVHEAAALLGEPARRFDLVISDVQMDGMSGVDLGRMLREKSASTPLILMSGFAGSTLRSAAADVGALVLSKPFALDALRGAVLTSIAARSPARGAS